MNRSNTYAQPYHNRREFANAEKTHVGKETEQRPIELVRPKEKEKPTGIPKRNARERGNAGDEDDLSSLTFSPRGS